MKLHPLFTAALALVASFSASAEDMVQALKVEKTDGTTDTYLFTEKPEVTFQGRKMLVTATDASTTYNIKDVSEFKFEQVSGIEDIAAEEVRFITVAPGVIDIVSLNPVGPVNVYDLQGRAVGASVTTQGNIVRVDISGVASGVYILKSNNNSIKITR